MTTRDSRSHPDEAGIEDLLHEVGAREEPSAAMTREVYGAVHAEWQALVRQRVNARRRVVWGLAASFALVVVVASFSLRLMTSSAPFATVAHVDGTLLAAPREGAWAVRDVGKTLLTGEAVQTDDRTRAALTMPDGVSVRLDRNTTVRLLAADRIQLDAGALYIDAPPTANESELTVDAHAASVRHLGTQYAVRTRADELEVGVREGKVLVSNAAGSSTAMAGEMLKMTAAGVATRTAISPSDASWDWAVNAAAPFDIDNQSLAAFLQWAARESGRPLVYASPEVQALAESIRLRGSIAGLDLNTALTVTLSTTQLRRVAANDAAIAIAREGEVDSTLPSRLTP